MATDMETLIRQMREEGKKLFQAAIERVNPYKAVQEFVRLDGKLLILGRENDRKTSVNLEDFDHMYLVGGGKASAPMARALEDLLPGRIDGGIINVKYGFTDTLSKTQILEADHPLPDQNGVEGTKKILDLLERAGERDLIFSLISGGGSALLPQPADRISLEEKQAVTRGLLACGASIDEINAIRKHISSSKGGQMARAAYPAAIVNLMLSDVVGDKMDVIASGPFVPDSNTFEEALAILEKYDLKDLPRTVLAYLEKGAAGEAPETPKEGDPIFERVHNFIIGSNILALEAAEEAAKRMGYQTLILSSMVEGETRDVARVHAAIAKEILKTGRPLPPPACIISGGETTVTIRGKGLGGRNQEFCLAAALDLAELAPRVVILSGGTDGNDGPTPAAGALVDPGTVKKGQGLGMKASGYLADNDAYHFFEKTEELLLTGPTRTNVMDVRMILVR
ncbi:MAG: glycerate kinase [Pseudomonadota bacterium]